MRAPPDPEQNPFTGEEDDSGNEDGPRSEPVGAFPGTAGHYQSRNSYY